MSTDAPIAPEALLPIYGKLYLMDALPTPATPDAAAEGQDATPGKRDIDNRREPPATNAEAPNVANRPPSAQPAPPPAQQAQPQAQSAEAPGTDRVKWKKPRRPVISFLIPKADYENAQCIQLLKKISDALKLPRHSAAFGKVDEEAFHPQMLRDAPTAQVVLFGFDGFDASSGTIPDGKTLYQTPALSKMQTDKTAKREAWQTLKPLQHERNH